MTSVTLQDAINFGIPKALQYCATDARFINAINNAMQQLIQSGHWVGSSAIVNLCLSEGNITWPRRVASVEAVALCKQPIPIRNQWFEFLPYGVGYNDADTTTRPVPNGLNWWAYRQLLDRPPGYTFVDLPTDSTNLIRVYNDNPADNGKTITIYLYDGNGNKIFQADGTEGIEVTLAFPYVTASTAYSGPIYFVSKDATLGYVRMSYVTPVGAIETPIAVYEPSEVKPIYRRSLIPGLSLGQCCTGCGGVTTNQQVTAKVKLEFIPVAVPTDILCVTNLPALQRACQAVKAEINENLDLATKFWTGAYKLLDQELQHYQGSGEYSKVNVTSDDPGPGVISMI